MEVDGGEFYQVLPIGWEQAADPATGAAYYRNEATGELTWHRPAQQQPSPDGAGHPPFQDSEGPEDGIGGAAQQPLWYGQVDYDSTFYDTGVPNASSEANADPSAVNNSVDERAGLFDKVSSAVLAGDMPGLLGAEPVRVPEAGVVEAPWAASQASQNPAHAAEEDEEGFENDDDDEEDRQGTFTEIVVKPGEASSPYEDDEYENDFVALAVGKEEAGQTELPQHQPSSSDETYSADAADSEGLPSSDTLPLKQQRNSQQDLDDEYGDDDDFEEQEEADAEGRRRRSYEDDDFEEEQEPDDAAEGDKAAKTAVVASPGPAISDKMDNDDYYDEDFAGDHGASRSEDTGTAASPSPVHSAANDLVASCTGMRKNEQKEPHAAGYDSDAFEDGEESEVEFLAGPRVTSQSPQASQSPQGSAALEFMQSSGGSIDYEDDDGGDVDFDYEYGEGEGDGDAIPSLGSLASAEDHYEDDFSEAEDVEDPAKQG